ncbi:MAG TPA: hypothetical protein VEV38_02580 [Candidatus Eremiobacteraceae bacterium]|nr:hypothetical protein [Candidatus Eremiobacteraceae bacterium]
MPKYIITSIFAILVCCVLTQQARADTQLGIQLIALSGTHFEPKENVSGTGFAGFIQLDERWRSVQLHLEGIPSVGTALVNTASGPVRSTLGMFSASARFRLDPAGRYWFGAGTQVLAQRTPQAGLSKIDASRLAGSRYELLGDFPVGARAGRFIETDIAAMPHLSGIVYETRTAPFYDRYSVSVAETAGMTDLSLAYGISRGRLEYLVGGRAINFAAKFPNGREADRNVGAGLFATMRVRL